MTMYTAVEPLNVMSYSKIPWYNNLDITITMKFC